jgi:hypothetical protein
LGTFEETKTFTVWLTVGDGLDTDAVHSGASAAGVVVTAGAFTVGAAVVGGRVVATRVVAVVVVVELVDVVVRAELVVDTGVVVTVVVTVAFGPVFTFVPPAPVTDPMIVSMVKEPSTTTAIESARRVSQMRRSSIVIALVDKRLGAGAAADLATVGSSARGTSRVGA